MSKPKSVVSMINQKGWLVDAHWVVVGKPKMFSESDSLYLLANEEAWVIDPEFLKFVEERGEIVLLPRGWKAGKGKNVVLGSILHRKKRRLFLWVSCSEYLIRAIRTFDLSVGAGRLLDAHVEMGSLIRRIWEETVDDGENAQKEEVSRALDVAQKIERAGNEVERSLKILAEHYLSIYVAEVVGDGKRG